MILLHRWSHAYAFDENFQQLRPIDGVVGLECAITIPINHSMGEQKFYCRLVFVSRRIAQRSGNCHRCHEHYPGDYEKMTTHRRPA